MALKLIQRVADGERAPSGYGLAWYDWRKSSALTMPVPFNVLARVLRDAWLYLSGPGEVPVNPRAAYREGYAAGRASTFDNMASMGVELNQRERREQSCD